MMTTIAYETGQAKAEEDFGLRLATDSFRPAIPHGDMNVAAERLAKHLSSMDSGVSVSKDERKKRFGNPVRWGGVTTPYGTGASSYDYSGVGRDGAAA